MTILRRTSRLTAGLGIAGASLLLLAGPAAADTSQAQATAARVKVGTSTAVSTGPVSATNAGPGGPGEVPPGGSRSSVSVFPGLQLVTAGAFAQEARALNVNDNGGNLGISYACAGALGGASAVLAIGANGSCTASNVAPGGVTVNLTPGTGLASLAADAVYARCTANSKGLPTGSSTIVNLSLGALGIAPIALVANGTVNQNPLAGVSAATLALANIASITMNEQTFSPGPGATNGGRITVRALHIVLLNDASDIVIGEAICGPNAIALDVSIFSGPALPVAATGAAIVGVAFFVRRRRQAA